ncbi:MAG: hypothetical protein ABI947_10855 [Chloroflexota bacterium]
MQIDQAVFLRIDTANGYPYLEGTCGESVVVSLLKGHANGWYDLLGFVVLPTELQILVVLKGKAVRDFLKYLETNVYSQLSSVQPLETAVFDTDFYREKVDCSEEVYQRLNWMHLAPVRSHLVARSESYPYSSANVQYRPLLAH